MAARRLIRRGCLFRQAYRLCNLSLQNPPSQDAPIACFYASRAPPSCSHRRNPLRASSARSPRTARASWPAISRAGDKSRRLRRCGGSPAAISELCLVEANSIKRRWICSTLSSTPGAPPRRDQASGPNFHHSALPSSWLAAPKQEPPWTGRGLLIGEHEGSRRTDWKSFVVRRSSRSVGPNLVVFQTAT